MIRGLDLFRERFREHEESLVLIGGAACHEWLARESLHFRATKDLDIVLLLEATDPSFVATFRQFVEDGGYEARSRTESGPSLYRFEKPQQTDFPYMLELFSRAPDGLDLRDDQRIVPITTGKEEHSLSALLLDSAYYQLLRQNQSSIGGIQFAKPAVLILLKAKAWLDLTQRKKAGEDVDSKNIRKHRNDVFLLAGILAGEAGPQLADNVRADLASFLSHFPPDTAEWGAIQQAIEPGLGSGVTPGDLLEELREFFQLGSC